MTSAWGRLREAPVAPALFWRTTRHLMPSERGGDTFLPARDTLWSVEFVPVGREHPVSHLWEDGHYVYFAHSELNREAIKVGVTSRLSKRMDELHACPLMSLKFSSDAKARKFEKDLHKEMEEGRIVGEWFHCSAVRPAWDRLYDGWEDNAHLTFYEPLYPGWFRGVA